MPGERKLYVITRRDLAPEVQAVMALHVAVNYVHNMLRSMPMTEWTEHGPPIVLMATKNVHRLEVLAERFHAWSYSDPDLGAGLCAIAIYDYHWNHEWARIADFFAVPADH